MINNGEQRRCSGEPIARFILAAMFCFVGKEGKIPARSFYHLVQIKRDANG
jgi:hypothetical protein